MKISKIQCLLILMKCLEATCQNTLSNSNGVMRCLKKPSISKPSAVAILDDDLDGGKAVSFQVCHAACAAYFLTGIGINRRTVVVCHWPPLAVGMPRAFKHSAIPTCVVTRPLMMISRRINMRVAS